MEHLFFLFISSAKTGYKKQRNNFYILLNKHFNLIVFILNNIKIYCMKLHTHLLVLCNRHM
jgi:hypothetical protein